MGIGGKVGPVVSLLKGEASDEIVCQSHHRYCCILLSLGISKYDLNTGLGVCRTSVTPSRNLLVIK